MSANTVEAYKRDVLDFFRYLERVGSPDALQTTNTDVVSYLLGLKSAGKSASTVNRKLASLRTFFNFLKERGHMTDNPTMGIKSPKVEKKEVDYLSIEEVDNLLAAPKETVRGRRDKAILEMMYATGIRVNELIAADVEDVNLRIGFFTCTGETGKARIIPLGRPARAALEDYIYSSRDILTKKSEGATDDDGALFVNYYGKRMTRQGLWKILKEYGQNAGLSKKLTPHILRNSFAVHMIQNGADIKSLQELLGHEDIAATQSYLSVTKNRIKDVYDKTHPRA